MTAAEWKRISVNLVRSPAQLASAISIALAVGANAAVFSITSAIWFPDVDVPEPDRVVAIYRAVVVSSDGALVDFVRPGDIDALSASPSINLTFEVSPTQPDWLPTVRVSSTAAPLAVRAVAHNYFQVLGVPIRGRAFGPDEDVSGQAVAVISRTYWQGVLGADPSVLGRVISTTRGPLVIVGIVDSRFSGPRLGDRVDAWIPLGCRGQFSDLDADGRIRHLMPVTPYARLRPGATRQQLAAEVRSVAPDMRVRQLRDATIRSEGDAARQEALLAALWITAALVLVLGCTNLASVFIARSESRRREFAVRLALGAPPGALVRLALSEAALLALAGLGAGLLFRALLLAGMAQLKLPSGLTIDALHLTLDRQVLVFSGAVAIVAGGLAGMASIQAARRTSLAGTLAAGARAVTGKTLFARRAVLGAQVTLSMVLLVGALTLTSTIVRAFQAGFGFDIDHTVFVRVRPRLVQEAATDTARTRQLLDYQNLVERLRAVPGVTGVTNGPSLLEPDDTAVTPSLLVTGNNTSSVPVALRFAGPKYLTILGARFLAGRDITDTDASRAADIQSIMRDPNFLKRIAGSLDVRESVPAVVDTTFARIVWPGLSPIGRTFTHGALRIRYEVVGLIERIPQGLLTHDDVPTLVTYVKPEPNGTTLAMNLVFRTSSGVGGPIAEARSMILATFPDPTLLEITTGKDIVVSRTARQRMVAWMTSCEAAISVALAFLGVFGVTAYMVARGRRELATRAALGAPWGRLRLLILRWAFVPVVAGVCVGGPLSMAVYGFMSSSMAAIVKPTWGVCLVAGAFLCLAALATASACTRGLTRINLTAALAGDDHH